jgi:UDP-2-acetamido-3-amino-2,3-dideoxy-glucuronate N-acetyltransferase
MSNSGQQGLVKSPKAEDPESALLHALAQLSQDPEISAESSLAPDVVIGKNVKLYGKVRVESGVTIYENATLLGPLHIAENAVIGPGVIIGLVRAETDCPETHLMESCRVGKAVQILTGLHIGQHARIRAGSVVTGDVPSYGLASQNPAILERYACPKCGGPLEAVRGLAGAFDTRCSDCGAGDYRFAASYWKDAFHRVLLPNQTLGVLSLGFHDDPSWSDEKEIG